MFRILIVDDEHIILNGCSFMIKETLELPFPVEVLTANNVPQAISILEEQVPELILTDIRMPVMDGFSLIEYIRRNEIDSDIVILTSHADFEYARKALRYGVNDFILKPIDEASLKKTILDCHQKKAKEAEEQKNSYYMKILTMFLYDISAADLLLTDEILNDLFPFTYFSMIVAAMEEPPSNLDNTEALLKQYYNTCHCYYLSEQKQLICLCNHDTFFVKPADLKEKLFQTLGIPFILGTSISSSSIHKLHHLYTNACQRIFYHKAFGSNENLTGAACFSYQDCIQVFNETDESKMQKALLHYIERINLVKDPSSFYLEQIYISFFQNIVLYLEHVGIRENTDEILTLPQELDSTDKLIKQIIFRICQIRQKIKSDYSDENNEVLINQLLDFIKSYFQNDISLDDLSEAVGMHPNYICSFFKKATGQSYLTCLHKERIFAAKKMLKETDLSIESIARQVGYNSSTQFARIFRKYEEISPSEFRSQ